MGTKRFISIGDLSRFGAMMTVTCLNCGHRAELHPHWLSWFCGHNAAGVRGRFRPANLGEIAARLRCTRCGKRKVRWGPQPR